LRVARLGDDQAGEHQVHADQLHRCGDRDGEDEIEPDTPEPLAQRQQQRDD
jgi:hypothetical protein